MYTVGYESFVVGIVPITIITYYFDAHRLSFVPHMHEVRYFSRIKFIRDNPGIYTLPKQ